MIKSYFRFQAILMMLIPFLASTGFPAEPHHQVNRLEKNATGIRLRSERYGFEWSSAGDRFLVTDARGRTMVAGVLQPAVVVRPRDGRSERICRPGKVKAWDATPAELKVSYQGVNSDRLLEVELRFEEAGFWLEPVTYHAGTEDVIALHWFGQGTGTSAQPTLDATHWVLPGLSESSALGPMVQAEMGFSRVIWLGRGATGEPGLLQQWGLPAHFFVAMTRGSEGINLRAALSESLSESLCLGLGELPAGDLLLDVRGSRSSLVFSYRSDLWGQLRGPARLILGARLRGSIGTNYYEAIRNYYLDLVKAGVVHIKQSRPAKASNMLAPQFNSWGAQVAISKGGGRFDEAAFQQIHAGLQASGMKAGMFVFDDKWEGIYGGLAHSTERFPNFERVLSGLRSEGRKVGMWAAFLRVERPADLGLTTAHVLHGPDGSPYRTGPGQAPYYLLDVTQSKVQEALRGAARRFVRRYHPDLVKFDFGYELPSMSVAAPQDKTVAGERLFHLGVEVIAKALREENPDIALMYYSLSPLFVDYLDLHSPDDLFLCQGEYDLEANRRYFFSSLLGELGMPTYGSGGYDWETMPSIWFDSAAVGTLGSLLTFSGDERGQLPRPEWVAKFNGIAQALRPTTVFSIEPYEANWLGPARAARTPSWVRRENGQVTLIALRRHQLDGREGSGRYADILTTTASVIVASKTEDGITRAARLAVVPYGEGEVALRRATAEPASAEIREHAFDGKVNTFRVEVHDGWLRLPLRQRAPNGSPVEWLEVSF